MNAERSVRMALTSLEAVGPARARWLLGEGSPPEAWDRLLASDPPGPFPRGVGPDLWAQWVRQARDLDLDALARTTDEAGVAVLIPGDVDWPFDDDPEPPLLLYAAGHRSLLGGRPAVAVVGARRCTQVGRRVATELGVALAEAEVTVVSGLALGIDAAAHRGALSVKGSALAVVATGTDRPYPAANAELWREVSQHGLIVSEAGLGIGPQRWRFPARNRIIAALADVTVVVESGERGGAMYTVAEALNRDRTVMAVPGSVLNPAAAGTNRLLAQGAEVAATVDDVLCALGPMQAQPKRQQQELRLASDDLDECESEILALLERESGAGSVSVDLVLQRIARPQGDVLAGIQRLAFSNRLEREGPRLTVAPGGWR